MNADLNWMIRKGPCDKNDVHLETCVKLGACAGQIPGRKHSCRVVSMETLRRECVSSKKASGTGVKGASLERRLRREWSFVQCTIGGFPGGSS